MAFANLLPLRKRYRQAGLEPATSGFPAIYPIDNRVSNRPATIDGSDTIKFYRPPTYIRNSILVRQSASLSGPLHHSYWVLLEG